MDSFDFDALELEDRDKYVAAGLDVDYWDGPYQERLLRYAQEAGPEQYAEQLALYEEQAKRWKAYKTKKAEVRLDGE
jgi:hypothetical protein